MRDIPEREHIVIADEDGQRFDRWVKKAVPDMPYGLSQKLIRKGAFRIDGKRAKGDSVLSEGQVIRIPPYQGSGGRSAAARGEKKPEKMSSHDKAFMHDLVLYDEGGVIAINKPAGLATQGGSKIKRHLDGLLPALADKDGVVPRLVHRLDKDTSGVMLLARSAKIAKDLGRMFKNRSIDKIYWAITRGVPAQPDGLIRAPLAKSGPPGQERMRVDEENGQFAETDYVVMDYAHKKAAFIAFSPRTGRTHQIRVHAELMGCPLLGDGKYAGRALDHQNDPEQALPDFEGYDLAQGLHLHARSLSFAHPVTGKSVTIMAPVPADKKKTWKALGFNANDKSNPFN